MGWLNAPEERRRQHVQVIAGGNIKDLDRIHERDRWRRITFTFWFLFLASGILGYLMLRVGFDSNSFYLFGFSILMLIILIFRYGLHKKIKLGKNKDGWEKIHELPGWAYKKMKRKHSNWVRGEHYIYRKDVNGFYRKLR